MRYCQQEGCGTPAQGSTKYCISHGGGPRCQHEGCGTSARGSTKYCISHGGGPRCQHEGCGKSAQGSTKYCARHGGGPRCQHEDHNYQKHPDWNGDLIPHGGYKLNGKILCHQHFYNEVNPTCRAIRREPLVLGDIACSLPHLLGISHDDFNAYYLGNDFNVKSCHLLRRPDMLFMFPNFALLLEIDENKHKYRDEISEIKHIQVIHGWCKSNYEMNKLWVFRINPDGQHAMFKKVTCSNNELVWKPTEHFASKMDLIKEQLIPIINTGLNGGVLMDKILNSHNEVYVQKMFF